MRKEFNRTKKRFAVTFSLPASATQDTGTVQLLGDFNAWGDDGGAIHLDKQKDGSFSKDVMLEPGRQYAFRFLLDGEVWENAHDADAYVASPFSGIENSLVSVPVAPQKAPAKKASAKKPVAKKKPASKRKKVKTDDLKVIEGVGPKIAGIMAEAGVKTWADMAAADPARLKEILQGAGSRYRMHDPSTWPKQASLAAADDWDGLKALQDSLKGGK